MSDFPKLSKGTGIPFFEGSSFRMNHFGSKKSLYYMAFWIVEPVLVWLASKIFVPIRSICHSISYTPSLYEIWDISLMVDLYPFVIPKS